MNILFFTKGDISIASSRQRVWRVAERLKKQYEWNYEVMHSITHSSFSLLPSHIRSLKSIFSQLRDAKYEILFIHKSLFPWDIILLVIGAKKFFGKKLVYDLDDAEWVHSPQKSAMLAKHADAVFCGSHEILTWAKCYAMNCVFIPTVLDVELYAVYTVLRTDDKICTIGWIGQGRVHFKAGNFKILKEALVRLYTNSVQFRFIIVGSQQYQPLHDFFSHTAFEVVFIDEAKWVEEDAVPKLISQYQFDVGVMPLVDTPFNRAKCAFKAIEYMACSVPVVSSPVGEAVQVVRDGENGILATTEDEWVSAIRKLAFDAQLRQKMGAEGQKIVHDFYSFQSIIPRIKEEIVKVYK